MRASATFKQSFSGIGAALGSIGFARIGKEAFEVAAGFEASRIGIKALLGDAEKAEKLFTQIQNLALQSPFNLDDLLVGTQRLIGFNTEAEQIPKTLDSISAAIGAIGGDRGKLADMITAFGQVRGAVKLTGEELRQLRNLGAETPLLEGIAKRFKVSAHEVTSALDRGIVPGLRSSQILVEVLTERFGKFNEEVAKTAKVAFSNLLDAIKIFVDNVGQLYLPKIRSMLNEIRQGFADLGKSIKQNPEVLTGWLRNIANLAGVLVASKISSKIVGLGVAISEMGTIAVRNSLLTAGLTATLVVLGREALKTKDNFDALTESTIDLARSAQIIGLAKQGKTADELKELGFSANQVEKAFMGAKEAVRGEKEEIEGFSKVNLKGLPKITVSFVDAEKEAKDKFDTSLEMAKQRASAEERAADILDRARKSELAGMDKIIEEFQQYRKELGLSTKAVGDLNAAEILRAKTLLKETFTDAEKELRKAREKAIEDEVENADKTAKARADAFIASQDLVTENRRQALQQEDIALQASRDRQMRIIEARDDETVAQKQAIEADKAAIEIGYLKDSSALKLRLLNYEQIVEIAKAGENALLKLAIDQKYVIERQNLEADSAAAIAAINEDLITAQGKIQRDAQEKIAKDIIQQNQRIFDSVRHSALHLLDSLLATSRTWGERMKAILNAFLLTPLKEFSATLIATLLTGQRAASVFGGSRAGGGGLLGGIFGGLTGMGGGGGFGSPGAPGGTPGFSGPVGGAAGRVGGLAGMAGGVGGIRGILANLGNIGFGPKGGDFGGEAAGSFRGIGGTMGGALLLGGAALGGFGLQRGGLSGLAMAAGGGALIGAKFGGLFGAGIGAAIGGIAGLARLFIKGSAEKIQMRVKSLYGVDIDKKFATDPLAKIIKDQFGGNIDVGLQSPAIRELITLYAMSRGQSVGGALAPVAVPSVFGFRGSSLITQPSYFNGQVIPQNTVQASPQAAVNLNVVLDPEETKSFWETQTLSTVSKNPGAIQSASVAANERNISRRKLTATMLAPGVVVS